MRRIRLLGFALLAVFVLGVVVAATAAALEGSVAPGLLLLPKEAEGLTVTGKGKQATIRTAAASFTCESSETLTAEAATGTHIELIKIDMHLKGCKSGKLACNTEGDAKEVILILLAQHFVDWKGTALDAGFELVVLNAKHEEAPISIKCGVGIVELKGSAGADLQVASLTADITSATAKLPIGGPLFCDPEGANTKLCKEILETKPFEANFSGKFEKAEAIAESSLEFSKMVEVDD